MLLVGSLIFIAYDKGPECISENAGAQDVEHDLDMLKRLACLEHDKYKVPSH